MTNEEKSEVLGALAAVLSILALVGGVVGYMFYDRNLDHAEFKMCLQAGGEVSRFGRCILEEDLEK